MLKVILQILRKVFHVGSKKNIFHSFESVLRCLTVERTKKNTQCPKKLSVLTALGKRWGKHLPCKALVRGRARGRARGVADQESMERSELWKGEGE